MFFIWLWFWEHYIENIYTHWWKVKFEIAAQIAVVALKNLLRDMYVDDVATCFQNIEECLEFFLNQKKIWKKVVLNFGSGILIIKN